MKFKEIYKDDHGHVLYRRMSDNAHEWLIFYFDVNGNDHHIILLNTGELIYG